MSDDKVDKVIKDIIIYKEMYESPDRRSLGAKAEKKIILDRLFLEIEKLKHLTRV